MFSIGDSFIYGNNGICKLIGIQDMTVWEETRSYYVLRPVFQANSTVFVSIGNKRRKLECESF